MCGRCLFLCLSPSISTHVKECSPREPALLASLTRRNGISFVCDTGLVLLLCWHCSSRPLVCESANDRGFCFVRQQRCKKKKRVRNASVAHSPLAFHSTLSYWLFYQANLLAGTSEYLEFFLICVVFFLIKLCSRPVEILYLGGPLPPPPHANLYPPPPAQRFRPGAVVQRLKACNSK